MCELVHTLSDLLFWIFHASWILFSNQSLIKITYLYSCWHCNTPFFHSVLKCVLKKLTEHLRWQKQDIVKRVSGEVYIYYICMYNAVCILVHIYYILYIICQPYSRIQCLSRPASDNTRTHGGDQRTNTSGVCRGDHVIAWTNRIGKFGEIWS